MGNCCRRRGADTSRVWSVRRRHCAQSLLKLELTLGYRAGWPPNEALGEALARSWSQDQEFGATQVGPQRAELTIRLDGIAVKDRISRGQQKLLAAALLISQLKMFPSDAPVRPTLLLDDPAAELDEEQAGQFDRRGLRADRAARGDHASRRILRLRRAGPPLCIGCGNREAGRAADRAAAGGLRMPVVPRSTWNTPLRFESAVTARAIAACAVAVSPHVPAGRHRPRRQSGLGRTGPHGLRIDALYSHHLVPDRWEQHRERRHHYWGRWEATLFRSRCSDALAPSTTSKRRLSPCEWTPGRRRAPKGLLVIEPDRPKPRARRGPRRRRSPSGRYIIHGGYIGVSALLQSSRPDAPGVGFLVDDAQVCSRKSR